MLDFELQQRLKQHKADLEQDRRGKAALIAVSLLAGILIGVAGGYVYRSLKTPSYKTELNMMIVLAAESQNDHHVQFGLVRRGFHRLTLWKRLNIWFATQSAMTNALRCHQSPSDFMA